MIDPDVPLDDYDEGPTTPQDMVLEFHEVFKPEHISPSFWPDVKFTNSDDLSLKFDLIKEEFIELRDAFNEDNAVEVVDALGDLVYVIYGMAIYLGVDLDEVVREIHRSNMTKLDENGEVVYREDGKVLKSDLYEPPRIQELLETMVR